MSEEKHLVVQVDDVLLDSLSKKLSASKNKPSNYSSWTIFRVPPTIGKSDETAYEPKIISIGPYHRGKHHLQAMEENKRWYLHDFLARSNSIKLEDCLKAIGKMEMEARLCYSDSTDHISSNDFVEMMVLDGCFMIELFLKQKDKLWDDPVWRNLWMLPTIGQDLLLLENQLPFFVLQHLFRLVTKSDPRCLVDLAFGFFEHLLSKNNDILSSKPIHHLLHLFHTHLLPTPPSAITSPIAKNLLFFHRSYFELSQSSYKSIPSAVELQAAGVKFKKKENARNFLDVKFNRGVIEIPPISIYESTNSILRNFIAFEQCYPVIGSHFTTYAILMNFLIDTSEDVDLLNESKILDHSLGSDADVALLFNRLSKGVTMDHEICYLQSLFKEVNDYSEDVWHSWRASLKRNYFSSPWAIISLIAAIFAFLLTVAMTFFTIYSYFRPPRVGSSSFLINPLLSM
ncbi:hypothetical protein AAC387_Pa09g0232 [Persea americana]